MDHLQSQTSVNTLNDNEEKNRPLEENDKFCSSFVIDKWLEELRQIPELDFCSNDDFVNKKNESQQCEIRDSEQQYSQLAESDANVSKTDYSNQNAVTNLAFYTFSDILPQGSPQRISEIYDSESEIIKSKMNDYVEGFISTLPKEGEILSPASIQASGKYKLTNNINNGLCDNDVHMLESSRTIKEDIILNNKSISTSICNSISRHISGGQTYENSKDILQLDELGKDILFGNQTSVNEGNMEIVPANNTYVINDPSKTNTYVKSHQDNRPFINKNLGAGFYHKHQLVNQSWILTGEKPFVCNKCWKAFKHSGNLAKHCCTQILENLFACDECEKRFNRLSNMNLPKRIHAGEYPFTCNTCDKRSGKLNNRNKHRATIVLLRRPLASKKVTKHLSS